MARLDFKEIHPTKGNAGDIDQFEKFSREFAEQVLGFNVFKGPSRGADGGIDIGASDLKSNPIKKWLISCKHYAHSGDSVGRNDEEDILDRTAEHGCDGFMGFYSTIASSGLEQKLERLRHSKGLEFRIYASEEIERLLLDTVKGFHVAKRFFPKSIQNVWPQVISMLPSYQLTDAQSISQYKWIVPQAYDPHDVKIYTDSAENAVHAANEKTMLEIHQPMFLGAWKDAVRMYPNFFHIPTDGIDSASDIGELTPNWAAQADLLKESPNPRWSILAIWSLVDPAKVREILKSMKHDASQQSLDLMSYEWLARSTNTERRDILTRLFAYYC